MENEEMANSSIHQLLPRALPSMTSVQPDLSACWSFGTGFPFRAFKQALDLIRKGSGSLYGAIQMLKLMDIDINIILGSWRVCDTKCHLL